MGEAIKSQDVTTSDEEQQTSIEQTPEFQKALSDHLAKAGREAKALTEKETKLREREERILKAEQDRELKELEDVRDDPEALSVAQKKIKLAADIRKFYEERDAFNKEKESMGDRLSKADAAERNEKLEALAAEKNVDVKALKKAAEKITDFDVLSEMADLFPKVQKETPHSDSGKQVGGGRGKSPSLEELQASNPFETQKRVDSGEWVIAGFKARA